MFFSNIKNSFKNKKIGSQHPAAFRTQWPEMTFNNSTIITSTNISSNIKTITTATASTITTNNSNTNSSSRGRSKECFTKNTCDYQTTNSYSTFRIYHCRRIWWTLTSSRRMSHPSRHKSWAPSVPSVPPPPTCPCPSSTSRIWMCSQ